MTSKPEDLVYLLYRSKCLLDVGAQGVDAIIDGSVRNNMRDGITGFLHLEDGMFYQWIEGPAPAIENLMIRLECDNRHEGIRILAQGGQAKRRFGDWQMGIWRGGRESLFNHVAERDLAVHDDRAMAYAVLEFMESLARRLATG